MSPERKRQILDAEEQAALMAALVEKGFYVYALPRSGEVGTDCAFTDLADSLKQSTKPNPT